MGGAVVPGARGITGGNISICGGNAKVDCAKGAVIAWLAAYSPGETTAILDWVKGASEAPPGALGAGVCRGNAKVDCAKGAVNAWLAAYSPGETTAILDWVKGASEAPPGALGAGRCRRT